MTSRHEGVTCDSCGMQNFTGRRYKCLRCYDYDLCATCQEAGGTSSRHTSDHPMQCILTRKDFDMYYGGESVSPDQPQSLTCPFCGKLGFTEVALQCHLAADHTDTQQEVVCPVCAVTPLGDPNCITDDLVTHLALEHRSRELISFITETPGAPPRGAVRRGGQQQRALGRARRNSQLAHLLFPPTPLPQTSMDNIVEMLSHYRERSAASQLQQFQVQVQMPRQIANQAAREFERINPNRPWSVYDPSNYSVQTLNVPLVQRFQTPASLSIPHRNDTDTEGSSNFLLKRYCEKNQTQKELEERDVNKASQSEFVRNILYNILSGSCNVDTSL